MVVFWYCKFVRELYIGDNNDSYLSFVLYSFYFLTFDLYPIFHRLMSGLC
jgi:hypothetical protein